jgi:Tfp pilus assembly protein PilZ
MRKPPRENRRRFRRRTVRVLVDYAAPDGVRCEYATTLGAGGLFIESDEPLPPGSLFKVRFRLPQSGRIHEIESRVAWAHVSGAPPATQAPGMGIVFTNAGATAALARELEQDD